MCQVSYYVSKYDDVIVIENDHKQYNSSTENVTFGCSTNARDSSLATCTVNISTSLHSGSLKYKLCVVYNASASSMQCSKDITINVTENNSGESLIFPHSIIIILYLNHSPTYKFPLSLSLVFTQTLGAL